MMGRRNQGQGQLFYEFRPDDAVPDDHLVRQIAASLDLSWVYTELAPYYSEIGRPSIDPVLADITQGTQGARAFETRRVPDPGLAGRVVDEAALARALAVGRLGGGPSTSTRASRPPWKIRCSPSMVTRRPGSCSRRTSPA